MMEGQPLSNADSTARWSLADVEKVEAELVYIIRHKTGAWPKYQTEIHFSKPEAEHQAAARQIWKDLDKQTF